jgi:hypothetical protein
LDFDPTSVILLLLERLAGANLIGEQALKRCVRALLADGELAPFDRHPQQFGIRHARNDVVLAPVYCLLISLIARDETGVQIIQRDALVELIQRVGQAQFRCRLVAPVL